MVGFGPLGFAPIGAADSPTMPPVTAEIDELDVTITMVDLTVAVEVG